MRQLISAQLLAELQRNLNAQAGNMGDDEDDEDEDYEPMEAV